MNDVTLIWLLRLILFLLGRCSCLTRDSLVPTSVILLHMVVSILFKYEFCRWSLVNFPWSCLQIDMWPHHPLIFHCVCGSNQWKLLALKWKLLAKQWIDRWEEDSGAQLIWTSLQPWCSCGSSLLVWCDCSFHFSRLNRIERKIRYVRVALHSASFEEDLAHQQEPAAMSLIMQDRSALVSIAMWQLKLVVGAPSYFCSDYLYLWFVSYHNIKTYLVVVVATHFQSTTIVVTST